MHPHAVKAPALDDLAVPAAIAELFVKADRFHAAVDPDLGKAQLFDPVFGFRDHTAAQVPAAIGREHNDAAEQDGVCIQRIKAAGGDRVGIVQQDDIAAVIPVVIVKFLPQRDMVLSVHSLDPDSVSAGFLPRFFGSDNGIRHQ